MKGKRVGVIGGGQLAWMMGIEAPNLNLELIIQTPHGNDPAVRCAKQMIMGEVDDAEVTAKLATLCDVITFENEFIDLEALQELTRQGVCFRPSLDALSPLLDKYKQRNFLKNVGLPVPKFSLGGSQLPKPINNIRCVIGQLLLPLLPMKWRIKLRRSPEIF